MVHSGSFILLEGTGLLYCIVHIKSGITLHTSWHVILCPNSGIQHPLFISNCKECEMGHSHSHKTNQNN